MSYPYHEDHPNYTSPDTVPSTPELPEIQQETPALDVKGMVEVVNPVRVYQLPSRHGVSANFNLAEGTPLALVGENLRRRRLLIIAIAPSGSTSRGIFVGDKTGVQTSYAALWPYGVLLPLENTEQVFVMPDGTGLATGHVVSIISEDWAD